MPESLHDIITSDANRYANLFGTQQIGRLYLVSYERAFGHGFHIFILPEGESAIASRTPNIVLPLNKDAVEVFGVTSWNSGSAEIYGWLHRGPWEKDFGKLVEAREAEVNRIAEGDEITLRDKAMLERERAEKLLSSYN